MNSDAFQKLVDIFCDLITEFNPEIIVGLESRGFVLAGAVCFKLKLPFVPICKSNTEISGLFKNLNYTKSQGEV